jgi:hypothetical protein
MPRAKGLAARSQESTSYYSGACVEQQRNLVGDVSSVPGPRTAVPSPRENRYMVKMTPTVYEPSKEHGYGLGACATSQSRMPRSDSLPQTNRSEGPIIPMID